MVRAGYAGSPQTVVKGCRFYNEGSADVRDRAKRAVRLGEGKIAGACAPQIRFRKAGVPNYHPSPLRRCVPRLDARRGGPASLRSPRSDPWQRGVRTKYSSATLLSIGIFKNLSHRSLLYRMFCYSVAIRHPIFAARNRR